MTKVMKVINKIKYIICCLFILNMCNVLANNRYNIENIKKIEKKCKDINIIAISGEKLNLHDLIGIAICNNPELKVEYINTEIAVNKKKQATS